MKKIKLLLTSILLASLSLVFISCEIDENQDLLFGLKGNAVVTGAWAPVGTTTERFNFSTNGDLTYIDSTGVEYKGSYTYNDVVISSIWDTYAYYGTFTFTWSGAGPVGAFAGLIGAPDGALVFNVSDPYLIVKEGVRGNANYNEDTLQFAKF